MNPIFRHALLFLMVFQLLAEAEPNTISAGEYPQTFKPGIYRLNAEISVGQKIEVVLKVVSCRSRFPHEAHVHFRWPGEGASDTMIGEMTVKINGQKPAFDRADYDYLGEPMFLSAKLEKGDYVILLSGGCAAGSYGVRWIFHYSKNRSEYELQKRIIQAGELPDVHQITDYTYYEGPPWPQKE